MSKTRFATETLRQIAGETTFSRGREYHHAGYVQILSLSPKRVVAEVAGTENYRTVVTGRDKEIDGNCSCPAFSDRGFCKHMVATALAANAAGDDAEGEAASALARIREHLKAKGTDRLVDLIFDLAEENPELFRKLDMDSAIVQADDKTLEQRLRKGIDGAARTGTYVDYQQARQWQAGVESMLNSIAELASGERAAVALKLVEHAIKRIENAFEAIDDSDGNLGSLLAQARDIHLTAAEAVRPEPVALARELFQREIDDEFGTFSGAVVDYSDVLGERGLAEYRRLADAEWKKLSKGSGRAAADTGRSFAAGQLIAILDFFAERDGDVEARIALRASDLSSQWDYLRLAEFCLSQGRQDEALRRAEEGLWLFEDDRPDERLLFFTTKLLTKARRKADAEAHLWRAFQKAPSLDTYKQLRSTGGKTATNRALALLESRQSGNKREPWQNRPDLLIETLMYEKRFDAAWSAVHKFGASDYTREKLVLATEVDYPRDALDFYIAWVERLANGAAYTEAVKVIARMAKLRSAAEHAAFMADLRARHGRKRSFMKLLG